MIVRRCSPISWRKRRLRPCSDGIWPAREVEVAVDKDTMRAALPLPHCRCCAIL